MLSSPHKTNAIVSPNKNVDLSVYSPLGAIDAGQVSGAKTLVFDGSDLMPSAASDAFGTAMQDFISNPDDAQKVMSDIEAAAASAYTK